jgi:hypothetical protein
MHIKILDTVVLAKDIPENGLRRGDIGAVVEVYEPDGVEVEFVTGAGATQALLTLSISDIRLIRGSEILAVRPLEAA